jgi:Meiotically up-regulated gene 113
MQEWEELVDLNEEKSGYVYLIEAKRFHGVGSRFIKRCKIGRSINIAQRLQQLNSSQAPCPLKLVKSIYVIDMSLVESRLHQEFKQNRVYKEWFDLLELWKVKRAYFRYEKDPRFSTKSLPVNALLIVSGLVALFLTSFVFGLRSYQESNIQEKIEIPTVVR